MMQMPEADDQVNPSFLGQMHPAHHDELGIALHDTAIHGYKRKLKKILAKGWTKTYPVLGEGGHSSVTWCNGVWGVYGNCKS